MNTSLKSLGIIILAAGGSSRLGASKQLLEWNGETLLSKIIRETHSISSTDISQKNICVVLGANYDAINDSIQNSINNKEIIIVRSNEWNEGIASSIRCGLATLRQRFKPDAVMICLCDQPFVNAEYLERLIETFIHSKKNIAASEYGVAVGVPVIFAKKYFDELLALRSDQGAKKLLALHESDVEKLHFAEARFDIDTLEDYSAALSISR